ncbi:hypothetical protein BJX66DRAFT_23120 [Aspergillus keveii]|uniref:Uncharacterized protein n=1 Tax=Aspergillus keveii TaxID=714993 RepID=A0ABR4GIA8_9EURO
MITKHSSYLLVVSLPLVEAGERISAPFSVSSAKLGCGTGLRSGLVLLDLSSHWSRTKTRLLESRSSLQPILARFQVLTLTLPRSQDSGPTGSTGQSAAAAPKPIGFSLSCFVMPLFPLSFVPIPPFLATHPMIPGDLTAAGVDLFIDSFPRLIPPTRL